MDRISYHNHEPWQGPCTEDRHKLIMDGGPADRAGATPTTAEDRAQFTLKWTVAEEDGLYCACCKTRLAEAVQANRIISTATDES